MAALTFVIILCCLVFYLFLTVFFFEMSHLLHKGIFSDRKSYVLFLLAIYLILIVFFANISC